MPIFALTRHALHLIASNFGAALRLTGPIFALQLLIVAGVSLILTGRLQDVSLNLGYFSAATGFWSFFVVVLLTNIVVSFLLAVMAVRWHRFVLMENTDLAQLGAVMPRYILRAILIWLIFMLLMFVAMLPGSILIGMLSSIGWGSFPIISIVFLFISAIVVLFISAIAFWLLARISLGLPAAAVGKTMGIGESWGVTTKMSGAIFVAALAQVALSFGTTEILKMLHPSLTLYFLIEQVAYWFEIMFGISVLTALYGHVVEGRDLV